MGLDYNHQEEWKVVSEHQSPIDLVSSQASKALEEPLQSLGWEVVSAALEDGKPTHFTVSKGGAIKTAMGSFALVAFHMHTPSEHLLGGQKMDGELHLVHRNQAGFLTVMGILFKESEQASEATIQAFSQLAALSQKRSLEESVDLTALLPIEASCFHYYGSLTTPPLTEGLQWLVFDRPLLVGSKELSYLRTLYPSTARNVQPLSGRALLKGSQKSWK